MKEENQNMKRALVKIAAVLQIGIGALLLIGTIALSLTAYQTVRNESAQLVGNLSATADALESLRTSYEQSAVNLFNLTDAMDDISVKLNGVSEKVAKTGELFVKFWLKGAGEYLKEVGDDVESISKALKKQGEAVNCYRSDGHGKTMLAMSETGESLRHVIKMLKDGNRSAVLWCGFVCVLGFCVSMLFFINGLLLCFVNRLGYKDA